MQTKFCKHCNTEKPLEEFNRLKSSPDGRQYKCRDCQKAYHKDWFNKNKEDKLAKNKIWREANAEHSSEYQKEYYRLNKESMAEKGALYYKKNKERVLAYAKEYNERTRDHRLQKQKEYYQNNKHGYRARKAAYRATLLNATPSWLTEDDLDFIKGIYKIREEFSERFNEVYHVDHIVPLQGENVCGLHVPWNLRVITARSNLEKSNKILDELEDSL